jgi:hypothetical protein
LVPSERLVEPKLSSRSPLASSHSTRILTGRYLRILDEVVVDRSKNISMVDHGRFGIDRGGVLAVF